MHHNTGRRPYPTEIGVDQFSWGLEHLPKEGSVTQPTGMIPGVVLPFKTYRGSE